VKRVTDACGKDVLHNALPGEIVLKDSHVLPRAGARACSRRATHNVRAMTTVRPTKILPPVWYLLALGAMWALDRMVPGMRIIPSPYRWLGAVPLVAGLTLGMTGARLFRRAGTGVVPFSEVTALVTTGPYRFTRNPMYLGLVLSLLGVAAMFGTATPWLVVPVFAAWIHWRFVRQEEAMLEQRFGAEYLAFKARVPRWV
jgi:protein-S-isoprenylcysteine O-methyltransferase Ste14